MQAGLAESAWQQSFLCLDTVAHIRQPKHCMPHLCIPSLQIFSLNLLGLQICRVLAETASKVLLCYAGSIAEILSSITNQYNGNGLQQGAGLVITGMLEAELKNNPVLLWMNGDVNYARSVSHESFLVRNSK